MPSPHKKREVYDCNLIINQQRFTKLEISQYYKTKPGREKIIDDLIRKVLIQQLSTKRHFPEGRRNNYRYFSYAPVYDEEDKAYKLVWCLDDYQPQILGIMDCYRKRKYDKKK
jgi:hypothetical protein